ncbi:recombinase family protein [Pseudomonas aeruginosa]|uniref:recombinase family protein n=1 Tax=Pseudomonas aeruginosa TaxID=287 RepID=UPI000F53A785|nr:recombinase family protein [Pseudomonas aeruginosa]MBU8391362.1 recombinase family protein [Pseudomonas aeruginosa]MCV4131059.1 recombinase family protein [Pseudomonas aeruginosa]RPS02743.1 DNA resolvase [Pseudomonas aeruginosa]HCK4348556.1 recombinase family protein [Pseudomonas aeruginosa]
MLVGYARVSTDDQSLELQTLALKEIGCEVIYSDQGISGADLSRPGLDQALRDLQSGDKLVVWRLDRLGRSLVHLVALLERLGKRNIKFQSITECIDTTSPGGRLIFHVMAALAEFERSLISERTRAGIDAAKRTGKKIGRPPRLTTDQLQELKKLIQNNELTTKELAERYKVHPRTLHRSLSRHTTPPPLDGKRKFRE